jgi:stearoyl-CoA desaturase (delta-9 desaturase)
LFYLTGFVASIAMGGTANDAAQFGLSLMVWGGAVRTVIVWHQTWFVNSAAHMWGYRNYETRDDSRNNVWAGLLCNGDGWHNNHHADPSAARHGHKPWEIDLSWLTIRLLAAMGLAKDVVLPSPALAARYRAGIAPEASELEAYTDAPLAPELAVVKSAVTPTCI